MPRTWKEAITIPVRKPGKESSRAWIYRLIGLMSRVWKLMVYMPMSGLCISWKGAVWLVPTKAGFVKEEIL